MGIMNTYQGLSENDLSGAAGGYGNLLGTAGSNPNSAVGSQIWNEYKAFGSPVISGLSLASSARPDYASQAGVDASQAAQQGREILQRNQSRMGINPNSGRFAGLNQEFELAMAAAKAGAKSKATREANQDYTRNLLQAAGIMSAMPSTALSAESQQASQAATGAQGLQGTAQQYGDIAAQKAQSDALAQQLQDYFGVTTLSDSRFIPTSQSTNMSKTRGY